MKSQSNKIKELVQWHDWVTPRDLRSTPIHDWFVFPHSFSNSLVKALFSEWGLSAKDSVLDPFCGAGTTLVTARDGGIPAIGYDLSPLGVMITQTKIARYDLAKIEDTWCKLRRRMKGSIAEILGRDYPALVTDAIPKDALSRLDHIRTGIRKCAPTARVRRFFHLALLAILPEFSKAVASGGWLKWEDRTIDEEAVFGEYQKQAEKMLRDVDEYDTPPHGAWEAEIADARALPHEEPIFTAVITSPPYPNRHDYTRVFGVELLFGFLDEEDTKELRYQTIHSHPEARPNRQDLAEYACPVALDETIQRVSERASDKRVPRLIDGYFKDMYLCLREMQRVCLDGAMIAMVVGNAQYHGIPVLVDDHIAEIGETLGLQCQEIRVVRYRGNSAQQMKKYGRNPSRESIVIFRR